MTLADLTQLVHTFLEDFGWWIFWMALLFGGSIAAFVERQLKHQRAAKQKLAETQLRILRESNKAAERQRQPHVDSAMHPYGEGYVGRQLPREEIEMYIEGE